VRRFWTSPTPLDVPLIEDSPYETLRYGGVASPALVAMAADHADGVNAGRVIYLGTFSKSIAPALRIGWAVGPVSVIARLALIKQASDIQVSTINQKVMLRVAPAVVPIQAERARSLYRVRRDAMLRALATHMPDGVAWTKPDGGFFVWMPLPSGLDAAALLKRAIAEAQVAFVPGAAFYPDRSGANTLRLSFSLNEPAATEEGIARLAQVIRRGKRGRRIFRRSDPRSGTTAWRCLGRVRLLLVSGRREASRRTARRAPCGRGQRRTRIARWARRSSVTGR
jgi:DNA-binding transcriptional MocR family regulator